jgi:hypothetical protein
MGMSFGLGCVALRDPDKRICSRHCPGVRAHAGMISRERRVPMPTWQQPVQRSFPRRQVCLGRAGRPIKLRFSGSWHMSSHKTAICASWGAAAECEKVGSNHQTHQAQSVHPSLPSTVSQSGRCPSERCFVCRSSTKALLVSFQPSKFCTPRNGLLRRIRPTNFPGRRLAPKGYERGR